MAVIEEPPQHSKSCEVRGFSDHFLTCQCTYGDSRSCLPTIVATGLALGELSAEQSRKLAPESECPRFRVVSDESCACRDIISRLTTKELHTVVCTSEPVTTALGRSHDPRACR
jgi:hypothetical protein